VRAGSGADIHSEKEERKIVFNDTFLYYILLLQLYALLLL